VICRVCDGTRLDLVIDLGEQPWCNHFLRKEECGKEPFYPLHVVHCADCKTAQLDHTVKKEIMFGDHTYLSGVTQSLSDHFRGVACEVNDRFFSQARQLSVLDIGSNDGTQLMHFAKLGWRVQGVESSVTTARMASEAGIPTLNAFFNEETAKTLDAPFHVINASGVFFHLEELHSAAEAVRKLLAANGVFVVQFLSMESIVANCAFDQIYHEHLLYYNVQTIGRLLARHGMELFDAYLAPIHGGSMIAFVQHQGGERDKSARLMKRLRHEEATGANEAETYRAFSSRIQDMRERNLRFLSDRKRVGKRIFGFGAPVKGNTLLNYFGIGKDTIECLVERNTLRKGLYSPGMHIPVLMEDELTSLPDVYYVLAWNFKEEILRRNQHLVESGIEFFFPVEPQVNQL
jgi:2-polyprenyl-3-methyl-5-hydroxy-6-metoxy-1,4-benzoquinol methylase